MWYVPSGGEELRPPLGARGDAATADGSYPALSPLSPVSPTPTASLAARRERRGGTTASSGRDEDAVAVGVSTRLFDVFGEKRHSMSSRVNDAAHRGCQLGGSLSGAFTVKEFFVAVCLCVCVSVCLCVCVSCVSCVSCVL